MVLILVHRKDNPHNNLLVRPQSSVDFFLETADVNAATLAFSSHESLETSVTHYPADSCRSGSSAISNLTTTSHFQSEHDKGK